MKLKFQLGTIVIALLAAGSLTVSDWGHDRSAAADPRTQTPWMCSSCGLAFRMTAREVMDRAHGPYDGVSALRCSGCGASAAYLARSCGKCGSAFLGAEVSGASGQCPTCGSSNDAATPSLRNHVSPRPANGAGDERKEVKPLKPPARLI